MSSARQEWKAGWSSVVGSIGGMMIIAAASSVTGILMVPISSESGWSRAQIAASVLIVSVCSFICAPACGAAVGRFGPRRVALVGHGTTAIGFALLALSGGPVWTWFGAWIAFGLLSVAMGPIIWSSAVSSLFERHRGLALSIALSGGGLAFTVMPPMVTAVQDHFGWRGVYLGLSLLTLLVIFPINWFGLRDKALSTQDRDATHPPADTWGPTLRGACRTRRFWQLASALIIVAAINGSLLIHFFPMLIDDGVPKMEAAFVAACIGPAMIVGRIFTGYLLDRIFAPIVTAIAAGLPILTCSLLWLGSDWHFILPVAAIALGFSTGGITIAMAYMVSRYFGLQHYASIFGVLMASFGLGFGFAPVVSGHVFDLIGNYKPVFVAFGLMAIPASLLFATLGAYPSQGGRKG